MKVNILYIFLLPLIVSFGEISNVYSVLYLTDILLLFLSFYLFTKIKMSVKYISYLIILYALLFIPHILKPHLYVSTIKQYTNIAIYFTYCFMILKYYKFNVAKIFTAYTQVMKISIIIAIMQLIAYYIGFKPLYDFSWILSKPWKLMTDFGIIRLNSFFSEPSYFGIALSPLVYISIHNIFNFDEFLINKRWSILIIIISMLTFSALSYVSIVISFLALKIKNNRHRYLKPILVIPFLMIVFFLISTNPIIFDRFLGLYSGITEMSQNNLHKINLSAFSLLNNLHVAKTNFFINPLFGGGLGSHPILYERIAFSHVTGIQANAQGGASMLIRLFSELGLMGLLVSATYLIYYNNKMKCISFNSIINRSILVYMTLILIRISDFGFQFLPLFYFIYMYTRTNKNTL